MTFAATGQAAWWAGLTPLICDVTPDTWELDPAAIERMIARHGSDIACVVPYAPFGAPLDLDYYAALRAKHGVGVVLVVGLGLFLLLLFAAARAGAGLLGPAQDGVGVQRVHQVEVPDLNVRVHGADGDVVGRGVPGRAGPVGCVVEPLEAKRDRRPLPSPIAC